jgi:DNA-binding transcriptional ArsR family regulator
MPVTRRAVISEQQMSRVFRALSDPTRRAVVAQLAHKPASMTELARPFRMALPSFAQHLSVLEECGVVRSHKEGRVRHYQLVPQPLAVAEDWMGAQRAIWGQRLDQLGAYVEKLQAEER